MHRSRKIIDKSAYCHLIFCVYHATKVDLCGDSKDNRDVFKEQIQHEGTI